MIWSRNLAEAEAATVAEADLSPLLLEPTWKGVAATFPRTCAACYKTIFLCHLFSGSLAWPLCKQYFQANVILA
jgi:hypothetical protein